MAENENPMYDAEMEVDLSEILGGSDGADQTEAEQTETEEATEPDAAEEEAAPGAEDQEPNAEQEEKTDPEVFALHHLGGTTEVDRQRVTELAQMGLDYERVKTQRDELRQQTDELRQYQTENAELVDFIRELAKSSSMSTEQLMDEIRVNQYVQKENVSQELARERVAREKLERKLQSREAQQRPRQSREEQKQQRIKQDIQEFLQKFPGVDPNSIDKSIWDEVNGGKTLCQAYSDARAKQQAAEIERLKAELEAQKKAARKNQENRAKSIGSQKAGTQDEATDKFLEVFLSDD